MDNFHKAEGPAARRFKLLFAVMSLAVCAVWADVDAPVADEPVPPVSELIQPAAEPGPDPHLLGPAPPAAEPAVRIPELPKPVSEPVPELLPAVPGAAYDVSYAGAALSAVIPGVGQIYQGRYWMGAGFFAAEAIAIGVTIERWGAAKSRLDEVERMRGQAAAIRVQESVRKDSAWLHYAGQYNVLADQAELEAWRTQFTAWCAFSWAVGIRLYSVLDALEADGLTARGEYRDPKRAGLLAAVPFLGLGQAYNVRPGKAGMIAMTQTSLMATAYYHHRLMNHASEKYNEMRDTTSMQHAYRAEHLSYWKSRYDRSFSRRNTYLWISLFSYLYSIFDAVVDAHLSDYQDKIDIGRDLAVGFDGSGVSVRLTVGLQPPR